MALPDDLPERPPGYTFLFKFGRAVELPAGIESIVHNGGGVYNGILESEQELEFVSTSAEDAAGGIGASDIVFFYQGEDGLEKVGTVALNGLTTVSAALDSEGNPIKADISYRAFSGQFGSTADWDDKQSLDGANVGSIICHVKGDATQVLWTIKPGEGQTLMCIYRVPSNKYLEIRHIDAFPIGNKPTVMRFRAKARKDLPWRVQAIGDALVSPIPVNIPESPQVARPGAVLAITATAEQVGTNVSSYFSGRLYDYKDDGGRTSF